MKSYLMILLPSLYLFVAASSSLYNGTENPKIKPRWENLRYAMDPRAVVQWEISCGAPNPQRPRETKQDAVVRAWAGALELAGYARARFDQTERVLRAYPGGLTSFKKMGLDQSDPGYLQFFFGDTSPEAINFISNTLSRMVGTINSPAGTGNPQRPDADSGGLYFLSCKSSFISGGVEQCHPGSTAFTANLAHDYYTNPAGAYTNFCEGFFELPRMDQRKAAARPGAAGGAGVGVMYRDMRSMDASVLLHEWTHINWIGPTNPPDPSDVTGTLKKPPELYGWYQCNSKAYMSVPGDEACYKNADSIAWYAEYGYWVTVLGVDIWPRQPSHHWKAVDTS